MITIAQRLFPFSHRPGSSCLVPGTSIEVEAFPTLLRFYELASGRRELVEEFAIDTQGPLRQFTLMQDLEHGCVTLFSEHYRLHILPNIDGNQGLSKKTTALTSCGLQIRCQKNPGIGKPANLESLSLGSHKKMDWDLMRRRDCFREIFPIWFRLGSLVGPLDPKFAPDGIFSLLKNCQRAVIAHHPEKILPTFEKLFLAGFRSMLVPRLQDDDFQGILPLNDTAVSGNPLWLLKEGARLIRSLFLTVSGNEVAILPNLPPEFFSGRILRLHCEAYGEIDLEWSKKNIRRLVFRASKSGPLFLHFKSYLKSFRLREIHQKRGIRIPCGEKIEIEAGRCYLLDQFQK